MALMTISESVGLKGINKPIDVTKVVILLKKAKYGPKNNTPEALGEAIMRFQMAWNRKNPDGRVDVGGRSLALLHQSTQALEFSSNSFAIDKVKNGGYKIAYSIPDCGKSPIAFSEGPYRVLLGHNSTTRALDVTNRSRRDVLDAANFAKLLHVIEEEDAWGKPLSLRLFVAKPRMKDVTIGIGFLDRLLDKIERMFYEDISVSSPVDLNCPVRPIEGKLLPMREEGTLTYQGDSKIRKFWGRMVEQVEGFDKYLLKFGGRTETDNDKRGFDCITYAGTVFNAQTTNMGALADLASEIAPTPLQVKLPSKNQKVSLESVNPSLVKEFFTLSESMAGYYLMYSTGHVVIVADGTVHEFSETAKGYRATEVGHWLKPYNNTNLTVRKITKKPELGG